MFESGRIHEKDSLSKFSGLSGSWKIESLNLGRISRSAFWKMSCSQAYQLFSFVAGSYMHVVLDFKIKDKDK